jgi:hypothetical protein
MAFLGKISAVISANTQDFTRNIGTAKKELTEFAKKVQGIELNLNTRALDGTLTKLQKFQRTIQEITSLRAKGIDLGIDPKKLDEQFRVFEDVGKPLTELVKKIEGLSNNLQAGLYPALGQVQRRFQDVYRAIQGGGELSKFSAEVDDLQRRLLRLGQAAAAAGDLGRLVKTLDISNVGASFAQPRAQEALQRSIALRSSAEQLPSRFREDGVFADLAIEADRNAARIEKAAARVLRVQLQIADDGETTGRKEALAAAQGDLNALTRRQQAINRQLQTQIRSAQIDQIVSPRAETAVDDLIAKLKTTAGALRAVGGTQFEGLISGAGRLVEQFNRGEASASQVKRAIDGISAALNSLNTGRDLLGKTNSLLFSSTERSRQAIRRDFDRERAQIEQSGRGSVPRAEIRRDANLARLRLNDEIIPRNKELQRQADELGAPELQKQAAELDKFSRQANKAFRDAFNSAKSGNITAANAALARGNALLDEQAKRYQKLAADINVANDARRQQNLFLEASGGRGEQLSQGARDAAADLSVARQFRGQIAGGSARIAIQGEIDRVTTSVTALQQKIAQVAASDIDDGSKIAQLDRLDNEIRQSTKGLAALIAQLSGGAFNTQQIEKAMAMARNSAGSISVRSAQVAQLAFQQALFAVDDLFSATGGLEYRLRAVGNNITQLGLLLGQSGVIPGLSATTGLFIGLSTVLAGQAVSAILRWATGAEEADRRTKLLNDALARQKSLAEDLRQAFESLGDSIARDAFSAPAKEARAFAKELESIAKKQREMRESRVSELDEGVQRERSRQSDIQRQLESERDPGRRVILARQLDESRVREEQATRQAVDRRATGADVIDLLRRIANSEMVARSGVFGPQGIPVGNPAAVNQIQARVERDVASVDAGTSVEAVRSQRAAIEREISRLSSAGGGGDIAALQRLLNSLEGPLLDAINQLSLDVLKESRAAATSIGSAQEDVANAIRRGVSGAADFQAALDNTAQQLDEAQQALRDASGIRNPEDRELAVRRAQNTVNDIQLRRDAIAEAAREVRLGQTFGGERTTRALSSLEGNERFRNEFGRLTAQVAAAADAEFAARIQLEAAQKSGNEAAAAQARAELEAAQRAGEVAALLAEAAIAMEGAVGRLRRVVEGALSDSENIANDAQRNFNERPADANRRARDEAEQQLIRDREEAARAQNAIDRRRSEAMSDPAVIAINDQISGIDQIRNRLEAQAKIDGTVVDPAAAERLANREAELFAERERRLFALTEAERAAADALAQEQAARRRVIEGLERERQVLEEIEKRRNPVGDPMRGRDLTLTEGERAAQELRQQIADIREYANLAAQESSGLPEDVQKIRDRMNEAIGRAREGIMRREAPTIAGMADAVRNAVLQGPSRAALNASDIATTQGQQELNRLLRGDDPAKNQDLVVLQREANRLLQIIADNEQPVAN